MDDIKCCNCWWSGKAGELVDFIRCPNCDEGKYIEDIEKQQDEPLFKHFSDYNWNKK